MRQLTSALLTASLIGFGSVGCGDDDDGDDIPATQPDASVDARTELLDANLDANTTNPDAGSPVADVSSKAADLAVTVNNLLGEHLILAAKATGAALRGASSDNEFKAYGALLNANGTELGNLVGTAFGDTAKTQFNTVWSAHNGLFVEYTTAVALNDTARKNKAVADLGTVYTGPFTVLVATATGLPQDAVRPLVEEHVRGTAAIVDAQAAGNWAVAYTNIRTAFAHMQMLGNPLAQAVAKQKPADFPGNAGSKAALFRVALNQYLQEHLFLATFATSAALNGRNDEFTAAGNALNANGTDIGKALGGLYNAEVETRFNTIWSQHNGFFVDYTTGVATNDTAKQTKAVNDLTGTYVPAFAKLLEDATGTAASVWTPGVTEHVTTTKGVVDAQNTLKTTNNEANGTAAATKDREAGHHMLMLGDPLSEGIVAKLPAKF